MLREHRPYRLKRAMEAVHDRYARHFLFPHFERVGEGTRVHNPWAVRVLGPHVTLGERVHILAARERPVVLAAWDGGGIHVGDYSVINPGLRVSSKTRVTLGRNSLLATDVYITDCDWHGAYDRVWSMGASEPVVLEDNVWVSERAVICRGVTIGRNSIVGAGAIVTKSVPANVVVAGNPARVVRELDPEREFVSREHVYADPEGLERWARDTERQWLASNTWRGWLRTLVRPRPGD